MLYMVFDVESVGLHGEGFAVGYVVVNCDGKRYEEGRYACLPERARGTIGDAEWVVRNVPKLTVTADSPTQVRRQFWDKWVYWRTQGAMLVTDCGWPVEARFLCACSDDVPDWRDSASIYPLHELASILLVCGKDPVGVYERMSDELPVHDPLADARQSARLLIECLQDKA